MELRINNNKMMRTHNKRNILLKLFHKGAMSRKALSIECNLTGAAISIIVKDMLGSGHLVENGKKIQQNIQGRKEVIVDINYENFLACNINIESDKIHFSLCTLKEIIREEIYKTQDMGKKQVEFIFHQIEKIAKGYMDKVIGIGIGVVGGVDESTGVLLDSYGIFPNNYNLKKELQELFGIPIFVCNNVRAHAKAIIDTKGNLLYIKHGPGLGLAIAINGEVINGFNNIAGEIGHTVIDCDEGKSSSEERDTLETFISDSNLMEKVRAQREFLGTMTDLYELYGKDKEITGLLDGCISKLACSITNAIILFDPQKVVVSGGIFDCSKTFESFIKKMDAISPKQANKIKLLSKHIKIKGMASSRLVFNELFFAKTNKSEDE